MSGAVHTEMAGHVMHVSSHVRRISGGVSGA